MNKLCLLLFVSILLVWLIYHHNKDTFGEDKKTSLAVISSMNPTHRLLETVEAIKKFYPEFDIVIVDSDSTDFSGYEKIPKDVKIDYVRNKNYEVGAWHYGYHTYPHYDTYMFTHDTITAIKRLDNFNTKKNIYIFLTSEKMGIEPNNAFILPLIEKIYPNHPVFSKVVKDKVYMMTQHSFFMANNEMSKYILDSLENSYIEKNIKKTKADAMAAERLLGILIEPIPINKVSVYPYFNKTSSGRM